MEGSVQRAGTDPAGDPLAQPIQRSTVVWFIALVGWTIVVCGLLLGGGAGFEPTDCWVAQTAREMYAGGTLNSLVVPRFSGETRVQKSPGPYWAVMLAAALRGQGEIDHVAARIPNAVAAVVIVIAVFWLARRIAGERAAVFAGFACASSVLILYWSRRGASDLGLAAFATVALASFWVAIEDGYAGRARNGLWLLGYLAAGLGMLYKLPMPVAVVGVPMLLYVLLRNRWRALRRRIHLLGLLVFLLPWLPWAIAVVTFEPTTLAKWKVEFWDRFTGDLPNVEGQRAWYFHFTYLVPPLVYCLPYSLSLPAALGRIFRPEPGVDRDGLWFLGLWFAALFAFFTASAGKELRYFLPALPPLFVLLGIELARLFNPARVATPLRDKLAAWSVWVLMPLAFAGAALVGYRYYAKNLLLEGFTWAEVWQPYLVTGVLFCVGAGLAAGLYLRRRENAAFAALVGTMWVTWFWVWPQALPVFASQRPFLDFAAQLRERIEPDLQPRLRQIGTQDARVIWYSGIRFPRIIDQLELLRMQGGRRSLAREIELVGAEMVRQLSGEELVLLVASRSDYVRFLREAPGRLAGENRAMPPVHLWLQTRVGSKERHFVVFGNRPPPWPEPDLTPPSERLNRARAAAPATPETRPGRAP